MYLEIDMLFVVQLMLLIFPQVENICYVNFKAVTNVISL